MGVVKRVIHPLVRLFNQCQTMEQTRNSERDSPEETSSNFISFWHKLAPLFLSMSQRRLTILKYNIAMTLLH